MCKISTHVTVVSPTNLPGKTAHLDAILDGSIILCFGLHVSKAKPLENIPRFLVQAGERIPVGGGRLVWLIEEPFVIIIVVTLGRGSPPTFVETAPLGASCFFELLLGTDLLESLLAVLPLPGQVLAPALQHLVYDPLGLISKALIEGVERYFVCA